jgi:hypothetical protein
VYGSNILEQLHHKYGHMSAGAIKRALKDKMIIHDNITYKDIKDLKLPICWQCLQGRMTASSKGSLSNRNYEIFEKIAVDYEDCSIKSKRGYIATESQIIYTQYLLKTKRMQLIN